MLKPSKHIVPNGCLMASTVVEMGLFWSCSVDVRPQVSPAGATIGTAKPPDRARLVRRENFGIPLLVHILEERPYDSTTACAADALRAISMNNDENKNRVREAWAIPLLVQLLGSDVRICPAPPACKPPQAALVWFQPKTS